MAIERAKIYKIAPGGAPEGTDPIEVCFNPKEYSLEKGVDWESPKAKTDAPVPEFKAPKPMTLSVTLQFDTYEERCSVRDKYIRKLEKLTFMDSPATTEKDVKKHAPPQIRFVWGKLSFRGVIESLSQKYTMFLSDGTPVRCECALKIRNVEDNKIDDDSNTYNSKNAAPTTKQVNVSQGDRLDSIAAKELGDASRWSEIADLNSIENPGDLSQVKSVKVPAE